MAAGQIHRWRSHDLRAACAEGEGALLTYSARTLDLVAPLANGEVANVPCGSCTACCRNEFKLLIPEAGDDVSAYQVEWVDIPKLGKRAMLANKPNGECVYLTESGCSIHDRAPRICRAFDCRRFFKLHTRAERREMVAKGQASVDVLAAGRERADTLRL